MPGAGPELYISPETLQEFRQKVAAQAEKKPENYDKRDLDRLQENDNYAKRFLRHKKGNMADALAFVAQSFKWRKEFGANDITLESLPTELLKINALFPYNQDKEDSNVLMFRVKFHKKDGKVAEQQKKIIVYFFEQLLYAKNARAVTVVFDCTESGFANTDLEMTKFIVSLFKDYYPWSLGYIVVHEMPWLFNAIWKVIRAMLPAEGVARIKFTKGENIREFIDTESLPKYLFGTCPYEYIYEPGKPFLGEQCPEGPERSPTPIPQ